jgi:hypothetical protein
MENILPCGRKKLNFMYDVDEYSSLLRTGGQKIYFYVDPQTVPAGPSCKVML